MHFSGLFFLHVLRPKCLMVSTDLKTEKALSIGKRNREERTAGSWLYTLKILTLATSLELKMLKRKFMC